MGAHAAPLPEPRARPRLRRRRRDPRRERADPDRALAPRRAAPGATGVRRRGRRRGAALGRRPQRARLHRHRPFADEPRRGPPHVDRAHLLRRGARAPQPHRVVARAGAPGDLRQRSRHRGARRTGRHTRDRRRRRRDPERRCDPHSRAADAFRHRVRRRPARARDRLRGRQLGGGRRPHRPPGPLPLPRARKPRPRHRRHAVPARRAVLVGEWWRRQRPAREHDELLGPQHVARLPVVPGRADGRRGHVWRA